jgi:hypothetical protein
MLQWDPDQFAFIKGANSDQICQALIELCAKEGMLQVFEAGQPDHRAPSTQSSNWTIQVLPGSEDWTLLRCSPRYLFVENTELTPSTRFAKICKSLNASGFIMIATNYERQFGFVLMEVEQSGEIFVSGYWLDDYDTSEGKYFFGYSLDTEECPWTITARSNLLLTLFRKVNIADINSTLTGKLTEDGGNLFSAMTEYLIPVLAKYQDYEVTKNFEKTGGKTLYFRSASTEKLGS